MQNIQAVKEIYWPRGTKDRVVGREQHRLHEDEEADKESNANVPDAERESSPKRCIQQQRQ